MAAVRRDAGYHDLCKGTGMRCAGRSVCLKRKDCKTSLVPGDHGTTYGGNPFACAAVSKVFDLFEEHDIVGHVRKTAPYLEKKLDDW